MGRLTTHVLDTARGCPGAGMALTVFALGGERREKVAEAVTNDDGRCDAPLLEGTAFRGGEYEIVFAAGDYFDALESAAAGGGDGSGHTAPRFLDRVVIRFGVANADEHYHVPLLISPFAYSTYRGS